MSTLVSDIISDVRQEIGDFSGLGHSTTQLIAWLNRFNIRAAEKIAQFEFIGIPGFEATHWTQTMTSGTASYAEPDDLWQLQNLWMSGQTVPLEQIPYERLQRQTGTTSTPSYFARFNGSIYLSPSPDGGVLNMLYWARPTKLTATTDTMPGGGVFDEAAVEALAARVLSADRFSEYDVKIDFQLAEAALVRAGFAAQGGTQRRRILRSSSQEYKVAHEV